MQDGLAQECNKSGHFCPRINVILPPPPQQHVALKRPSTVVELSQEQKRRVFKTRWSWRADCDMWLHQLAPRPNIYSCCAALNPT